MIVTTVAIHIATVIEGQKTYTEVFETLSSKANDSESKRELFDSFQNYYKEVNASNINLLSILLPVIGAWIGAILAFYYAYKNTEKLSETLQAATPPEEEKLSKMTVGEILEKFPEYKNLIKAKLSDSVGVSYKMISGKSTNIVITDDKDFPLGIIYKTDFTRNSTNNEDAIKNEVKSFRDFFNDHATKDQIKDLILDQVWTNKGVNNFARIEKKDTLLEARIKLQTISVKPETRGLVLDPDNKVIGVVTYEMFSKVLKEDALEKT